jgi:hypothetical protein
MRGRRCANRSDAMPRFYFHLCDDMDVPDEEGKELPDLPAARAYAAEHARFELGEIVKREGRITLRDRIHIEDDQHRILETVYFSDVVKIES